MAAAEGYEVDAEEAGEDESEAALSLSEGEDSASVPREPARSWLNMKGPVRWYREREENILRKKMRRETHERLQREGAAQKKEQKLMEAEEKRSWDAFELNERNYARMKRESSQQNRSAAEASIRRHVERAQQMEEGPMFESGMVTSFWRWRRSPALRETLKAHKLPLYTYDISACARYIATGGEDCIVKIWDAKHLQERIERPTKREAALALLPSAAADPTIGWGCVVDLEGHAAPIRDVKFHPHFRNCEKTHLCKKGDPPSPSHVLATASADGDVFLWDLNYSTSMCRYTLRGHRGVVNFMSFSPSGCKLVTCGWDGKLLEWDTIKGHCTFTYGGHGSSIMSIAFSPSGRYFATCSNYGERSIKLWHASMPVLLRDVERVGLRIRWGRSGVIKRIKLNRDPTSFFLANEVEREARESSDESEGEKERKLKLGIPQSVQNQPPICPLKDRQSSLGFSLSASIVDGNGARTKTEHYHRGCKLVLTLKGVHSFSGFYIGASSAAEEVPSRYGIFFGSLDSNVRLSRDRKVASASKLRPNTQEMTLQWKAPSKEGVGWLTFRAAFCHGDKTGSNATSPQESVWLTLKEVQAPMSKAIMDSLAAAKKPRKRSYSTLGRTDAFLQAIQHQQWTRASGFLDSSCALYLPGSPRLIGSRSVVDWFQHNVGEHVTYFSPISVGVAWTSVEFSHELPEEAACTSDALPSNETTTSEPTDVPRSSTDEGGLYVRSTSLDLHGAVTRRRPLSPSAMAIAPPKGDKDISLQSTQLAPSSSTSMVGLRETALVDDLLHDQGKRSLRRAVRAEMKKVAKLKRQGIIASSEIGIYCNAAARFRSSTSDQGLHGAQSNASSMEQSSRLLIWGGKFGADVDHMRMPLPELYPTDPKIQYDVPEEGAGRLGEGSVQQLDHLHDTESTERKVLEQNLIAAGVTRELQLRKFATRRRGADMFLTTPGPSTIVGPLSTARKPASLVRTPIHPILQGPDEQTGDAAERRIELGQRVSGRRGALSGLDALDSRDSPDPQVYDLMQVRRNKGLIRCFTSTAGDTVCHQDDINQVAFSPDDSRVASASSDGTVKLWDPAGGQAVETLKGHEGPVFTVGWSSNSAFLVTGGADRSLIVWSMLSFRPIQQFRGHTDVIHRTTFLPQEDSIFASCSSDGTLRTWATTPQVPRPPPKPTAVHIGRSWVNLAWPYPAAFNDELTAFFVRWRRGEDGDYDESISVAGTTTQTAIQSLIAGSLYYFQVAGVNHMGEGPWSEDSDPIITEMDIPQRIDRPTVEGVTSSSISVSFLVPKPTTPEMKSSSFLMKAAGNGFNFDDGEPRIVPWEQALATGEQWVAEKSKNGDLDLDDRHSRKHYLLMHVTIENLAPGMYYRITAAETNALGTGADSDPTYSTMTLAEAPGKMQAPALVEACPTSLKISWVPGPDGGSAITFFHIKMIDPEGLITDVKCKKTERSKSMEKLERGTCYHFLIRACNNSGVGPWSESSLPFRTLSQAPDVPDKPVILSMNMDSAELEVPNPSSNGDSLTDIVVGVRAHKADKMPTWSSIVRFPATVTGPTTRLRVDGLLPDTLYSFRAAAENGTGQSSWGPACARAKTAAPLVDSLAVEE